MKRVDCRWQIDRNLLRLALFVTLATLPFAPAWADPPAAVDPLPLRRILVAPERVAAELERVRQGVLVQLPRPEFEARVKQAVDAGERLKTPPRLAQARYWARLEGTNLVGSGDWTVINPSRLAGVLALPDLNLALSRVKVGASEAVLGDLVGKTLGLLVEGAGEQSVFFDWTLRGGQGVGGLHFDLQIPPCAVASLELTLPADCTVSVSHNVAVLSGPHDAGDARQRLWRLRFSGRSAVDLVVRKPDTPDEAKPLLLANLASAQQLTPARVRADFDFQVEILHHPTAQLVFDLDPLLEPFDVTLRNYDLKEWKLQQEPAGPRAGKPTPPAAHRALVVQLREPFLGVLPLLRVRCLAKLPTDRPWTSPWMRLRDAAVQGETLTLKVHPDVRLENWQAGSFRLMDTSTRRDGTQVLTLLAGNAAAAPTSLPRPAARLRTQGVDFLARQRTWWQIGPQGSSLTAQITYEVSRGSLIELPVALPAGWQVEEVSFEPKEWLRNWIPVKTAGRQTLVVELQRALRPRKQVQLTVRLHSPQGRDVAGAGKVYPFPEVAPLDPCVRASTLAISVDPLFQAVIPRASVPATASDGPGPWGPSVPTFSFNTRNQPVTGSLRLVPRAATLRVACRTDVVLAPTSAGITTRLELEPVTGATDAIDLHVSAPIAGHWEWKSVSRPDLVRSLRRLSSWEVTPCLLALGARNGVAAASILALPPLGERWRLTLNHPLTRRETLTLHAMLEQAVPPDAGMGQEMPGWRWQLPVVTVPSAAWVDGEVVLHLSGTELTDVKTAGLREDERGASTKSSAGTGPAEAGVLRVYRHGTATAPGELPLLVVRGRAVPADRTAREVCDHAWLVTHIEPRGRLLHQFSFRVWNWRQHLVPVRLPAGSQVLAARVDGRWVGRLAPTATRDGVQLGLPVAAGESFHRLEIVYSSALDWPAWVLGAALEVPAPQLPVTPVSFRRTWRLPPGVAPLTEASVRRLPDALSDSDLGPWWDVPRRVWQSGASWLAALEEPTGSGEWSSHQRQVVEAAEIGMRPLAQAGKKGTLGAALERFALTLSHEHVGLVVDDVALRTANLRPETALTPPTSSAGGGAWQPFWESMGLVYLPAHGAALLTTRRQGEAWQAAGGRGEALSTALDEAVHEAALQGYDRSGRFRAVPAWADGTAADALPAVLADDCADSFGARWTEWEPVAGSAAAQALSVVRHDAVRVLGWALAGLLALLAWRGRHGLAARWRFRLLILWLAGAGLAALWLPAGLRDAAAAPALVGVAVALVWYGRWGATATAAAPQPPGDASSKKRLTAGTAATAVGLGLLAVLTAGAPSAQSGAPDGSTVLLVPAGPPDSGQQTALVSPALLTRLEELAQRGAAGLRGVVPVSATYDGKLTGTVAQFKAEVQVFNFADRATLTLALGGVELAEGALVDGAAAYPVALAGPQAGYTLEIEGRGPHTISLPFTARVVETAEHTDLAFTVPKVAQSRLLLTLPSGVQSPTVLSALGAQRAGAAGTGPVRVEADLGRESAVHVRWLAASRSPRAVKLQVREAYLWDVSQPVPTLTGVLHYLPRNGAAGRFAIRLPDGIDVRSVEVRQEGASPAGASVARLKTWRVAGRDGNRLLQVDLQAPITSAAQVTLGLVPRLVVGPKAMLLVLPTPVGAQPTEGFLAYRAPNWETQDRAQYLGVTNIPARTFLQVWGAAGMSDRTEPTRAYTFRRTPGGTSALGLVLQAPRPQVVEEVNWNARAGYADVQARAELQAAGRDLILVEWLVPAELTVADVQGPDVRHWSRADNRVQVWLRTARSRTTVELNGWVAIPAEGLPVRQGQLKVTPLRVIGARPGRTTVRVTPAPGTAVEPEHLKDLVPILGQGGATPLTYLAQQPGYKGEFRVRPAPVPLRARALMRAALSDRTLEFVAHVDYPVRAGPAQTLTLRLRHWEGEDVRLEAPGAIHRREQRPGSSEHTWKLTLPAGVSRTYHMKLVGKRAFVADRKPLMPDVTVAGTLPVDRWVAVTGGELSTEAGHDLAPVKDLADMLPWWPAQAETLRREGTAWKVLADDWRLRLVAATATKAPLVQVLSAEQEAALGDGRRWVYQAIYRLLVRGPSDLRLKLPAGARLLSVTLDGKALLPRQPAPDSLWLTQPGSAGPHTLRLRWLSDHGEASFAQPDLAGPHFEGLVLPAAVWTVHVPAGYDVRLQAQNQGMPLSGAEVELRRAEALVKLSTLLTPGKGAVEPATAAQLTDAQRQFYEHLRRAEYTAAVAADDARTAVSARVQQLRKENARLAQQHGFEARRALAEKRPWDEAGDAGEVFFALPPQGTPRYYLANAPDQAPQLLLTATAPHPFRETVNASELLLIVLVVIVLLSYTPRVTAWIRRLWPEQLLLLGCLGCQAFGVSPLGIVLVVVGVVTRLILLAGWVQRRWQASGPPARVGSSIGSAG